MKRLENFRDLGLHQQFHVEREFAAGAGDQAEEAVVVLLSD